MSNHQFEKIARQPLNRFKQCSNFSYIYYDILTARVKSLFDVKDVVVFLREFQIGRALCFTIIINILNSYGKH